MTFPDNLPYVIYYRVGRTVRVTLPRHPVDILGSSGRTNACEICPQIPKGATHFQLPGSQDWIDVALLPQEWLPYLNRVRPSVMDPRPALQG